MGKLDPIGPGLIKPNRAQPSQTKPCQSGFSLAWSGNLFEGGLYLYALLVMKPFLLLKPWEMFTNVTLRYSTAPRIIFLGLEILFVAKK